MTLYSRRCHGHRTYDNEVGCCSGFIGFTDEGYGVYGFCDTPDCTDWHMGCGTDHTPGVVIRANAAAGFIGGLRFAGMPMLWSEAERALVWGVLSSLDQNMIVAWCDSEWSDLPLHRNGKKVLAAA